MWPWRGTEAFDEDRDGQSADSSSTIASQYRRRRQSSACHTAIGALPAPSAPRLESATTHPQRSLATRSEARGEKRGGGDRTGAAFYLTRARGPPCANGRRNAATLDAFINRGYGLPRGEREDRAAADWTRARSEARRRSDRLQPSSTGRRARARSRNGRDAGRTCSVGPTRGLPEMSRCLELCVVMGPHEDRYAKP